MKAPHSSSLVLTTICMPRLSFGTLPTFSKRKELLETSQLLPVYTFCRPVWLTSPAIRGGCSIFPVRLPNLVLSRETRLTLTFRNRFSKPASVPSHDLWQKPHPCDFKILSFHKIYNTSVAFGQATSSGFLGSWFSPFGQKPLSPFLAPRWKTPKSIQPYPKKDSLPCKLHTIQMVLA